MVWRAYNTGPDKDVLIGSDFHPFYAKDQGTDLGEKTWPPDAWKIGGGDGVGLDLLRPGIGPDLLQHRQSRHHGIRICAPATTSGRSRFGRANPETGQAKWAYQMLPHDAWDYDEIMENIVVDMVWQGKMRKLLLHPGRNGYMMVIDRETGELLSATPFQPLNWSHGYDLKTGLPDVDPTKVTHTGI